MLDQASRDAMADLKYNCWYSCTLKEPRNPQFHAKIFALLNMTLDNLPETSGLNRLDAHGLLKAIQLEIGEVEQVQRINGEVILIPKSIAFENMDNIEFGILFKKVVGICSQLIGAEIDTFQEELN